MYPGISENRLTPIDPNSYNAFIAPDSPRYSREFRNHVSMSIGNTFLIGAGQQREPDKAKSIASQLIDANVPFVFVPDSANKLKQTFEAVDQAGLLNIYA